jgi:hypothetical protein
MPLKPGFSKKVVGMDKGKVAPPGKTKGAKKKGIDLSKIKGFGKAPLKK